jgi:ABC-type transport system involved in cytochrome c biogenesis ATPase subunit
MKLQAIELEKFVAFKQARCEFSPGLNVFVGANGTGKTHLLKLLYSVLKANEKADKENPASPNRFNAVLAQKLVAVFRPDPIRPKDTDKAENAGLGRLVFRSKGRTSGHVSLHTDAGKVSFRLTTPGRLTELKDHLPHSAPALFIPSREMLAMFEGFEANYDRGVLRVDETYRDLCVALGAIPTRGPWSTQIESMARSLEQQLGGRVHLVGGRFYVYNADGVIEAHLLSEGMRKLASLFRLLQNDSLTQNSFLFWDEPEANLNPRLVTVIASILRRLAAAGIQVFISSHDYLLTQELSLAAEFPDRQPPEEQCSISFFGFTRTSESAVQIQAGNQLTDLTDNPILDEFASLYDRRRDMFEPR